MISAIFDHLWQSTLVAGLIGLAAIMMRRSYARVRFRLWLAASIKFLVPFALLGMAFPQFSNLSPSLIAVPAQLQVVQVSTAQMAHPFATLSQAVSTPSNFNWLLFLCVIWTLGTLRVLLRWAVRWRQLMKAVKSARPAAIPAPLPVMISATVVEPGLVGIWRPILLLPEGLTEHLDGPEMDSMLAHELAHLRRHDNLSASLHMLVEALFWFHPLVWWIGKQLVAEREKACDEDVVESGRDPEIYVQSLFKVCKHYTPSLLTCAAGVAGGDLRLRMEGIMAQVRPSPLALPEKSLLACIACLIALIATFVGLEKAPTASPDYNTVPSVAAILQGRAEQAAIRHAVPFDPPQFDRYAGFYQDGAFHAIHLARIGTRFFELSQNGDVDEIFPESASKFFFKIRPVQYGFVTDATGLVTGMVAHQQGVEKFNPKIGAAAAAGLAAARARYVRANMPSPGSEAFVRKQLINYQAGTSADADIEPGFAGLIHVALPRSHERLKALGALKSLRFAGLSPNGLNNFEASFAHGKLLVSVMPPLPDGKIWGFGYQNWNAGR